MPSQGARAHINPELDDFSKGRESALNQAIIKVLVEEPRLNIYAICKRVNDNHFPVIYPTVYRRVVDLAEEAFWWLDDEGIGASMKNPAIQSRRFSLSLHGVLASVALWYNDPIVVRNLKKNYDLCFPIYFANRLNHPLADSWLIEGIGSAFRSDHLSINMSWDFFLIHAVFHLARRRRVMEKAGIDVRGLGINEDLLVSFWKDTAMLYESGWDKVTRMLDPKEKIFKRTLDLLGPIES
ncbi:MAG: hypothetical protein JRN67_11710 [Nitrososphaerota archaeon]|nr:hypothetical protein [Nitrososphaerota archaeon]